MFKKRLTLWFIFALTLLVVVVDFPRVQKGLNLGPLNFAEFSHPEIDVSIFGIRFKRDLEPKLGLDLQGGVDLILKVEVENLEPPDRDAALVSARDVIERRVNALGVSEPLIQTSKAAGDYRIIVQLPGVTNVTEALSLIGKTAQLDFRETMAEATPQATLAAQPKEFKTTGLTGKDLKRARPQPTRQVGQRGGYEVALEFTSEGAKKFESITARNVGRPLAIFLDEEMVSSPTVQGTITGGNAVITGDFTADEAKNLERQLNAGALPAPIRVLSQENIGPTLGKESINKSLIAGGIGLLTIATFMILNYGFWGVLADLALILYTLLILAIFKIVPVTLTLAAIAGFILSIGMAVDANILIFERAKEEMRWGRRKEEAQELGFARAWPSIRDSNTSSLITAAILFWLGTGPVKGFALTLAIGILVSMFSAITVTRTLLRTLRWTRLSSSGTDGQRS